MIKSVKLVPQAGSAHQCLLMKFDPRLPDGQTTAGAYPQCHLIQADAQHRCSPGMCAQLPAAHPVYPCPAIHSSNAIIKFADDTAGGDESAYTAEARSLSSWCRDNNLLLSFSKTMECLVDYRRLWGGGQRWGGSTSVGI